MKCLILLLTILLSSALYAEKYHYYEKVKVENEADFYNLSLMIAYDSLEKSNSMSIQRLSKMFANPELRFQAAQCDLLELYKTQLKLVISHRAVMSEVSYKENLIEAQNRITEYKRLMYSTDCKSTLEQDVKINWKQ